MFSKSTRGTVSTCSGYCVLAQSLGRQPVGGQCRWRPSGTTSFLGYEGVLLNRRRRVGIQSVQSKGPRLPVFIFPSIHHTPSTINGYSLQSQFTGKDYGNFIVHCTYAPIHLVLSVTGPCCWT